MNKKVKATGFIRHGFQDGEYSAFIVLQFSSPLHAVDAIEALGEGWTMGGQYNHCLSWQGNYQDFEYCKGVLVSYGADITSIEATSNHHNYSEEFSLNIPCMKKPVRRMTPDDTGQFDLMTYSRCYERLERLRLPCFWKLTPLHKGVILTMDRSKDHERIFIESHNAFDQWEKVITDWANGLGFGLE